MLHHKGYCRFPTVHGTQVAFVCEDDLWTVPIEGGVARRLTTSLSEVMTPVYSPDGAWIAFVARDEGQPEVYLMPADGGTPTRLTYQGANMVRVVGWTPDGESVIYHSTAGCPPREVRLWKVSKEGGLPTMYPYGVAHSIVFGSNGGCLIGRHTTDPARWKRYRGGTAGVFWIDREGTGRFELFKPTEGNLTAPMWVGERLYFVSDHEGIANLYSCRLDGSDLQRHTHHEEYYVRSPHTDGKRIVYHAGADLYVYDLETGENALIPTEIRSHRVQTQRKFVETAKYLQDYTLHPAGHSLLLTVRGKPFTMGNWEGAVIQHGEPQGVRYRISRYLPDGMRFVTVSDASGEERLELHTPDGVTRFEMFDPGVVYRMEVCPTADRVALTNHRFELWVFDLQSGEAQLVERSEAGMIEGIAWSPDGAWLAYSFAPNERTHIIKVYHTETGTTHALTHPEFRDVAPAWDPEGDLLYFISSRDYNPVYDQAQFELSFPMTHRVMAIALRKDVPNPLLPEPHPFEAKPEKSGGQDTEASPKPVRIDLDEIEKRVLTVPLPGALYGQVAGLSKKRLLVTRFPVEGQLDKDWRGGEEEDKGTLLLYDFALGKTEEIAHQ
ncbi:MAG: peptidase, partial [Fimbriimonadales bacterium]